jgi:hypothetical protein
MDAPHHLVYQMRVVVLADSLAYGQECLLLSENVSLSHVIAVFLENFVLVQDQHLRRLNQHNFLGVVFPLQNFNCGIIIKDK